MDYPTFKFRPARDRIAMATTRRDTLFLPDGSRREGGARVDTMQVIDLSSAALPSELFDVPAGIREVREIRRRPIMRWWGRALMTLHGVWSIERVLGRPFGGYLRVDDSGL